MLPFLSLTSGFVVLTYAWGASARQGDGTPDLNLDPRDTATFAFNIAFASLTFLQALAVLFQLKRRKEPDEEYIGRIPFNIILLFAMLFSTTDYALKAVLVSQWERTSLFSVNLTTVFVFQQFSLHFAQTLFVGGLMDLLRRRAVLQATQSHDPYSLRGFAFAVTILNVSFSLIMTIANVAGTAVRAIKWTENRSTYAYLMHVYLAAFVALSLIVVLASNSIRFKAQREHRNLESYLFDRTVNRRILGQIGPALVVRALFCIARHVIDYSGDTAGSPTYRISVLESIDVIVMGLTFLIAYSVSLRLGYLPKGTESRYMMANVNDII